jgi:shikimate kinase
VLDFLKQRILRRKKKREREIVILIINTDKKKRRVNIQYTNTENCTLFFFV